jgi:hypothetical protein
MTVSDPNLKAHIERVGALMTSLPEDQRSVCGALDALSWFSLTEGENSNRATEALALLLSDDLRPPLRRWYQTHGDEMNPAAIQLREKLSSLAGEKFA